MQRYWWPGNIRELENLIERLVATLRPRLITDGDLAFELQVADIDREGAGNLLDRALTTFERNYIIRALERSRWNVTQTAKYLGIPPGTLKFKLDRLEIKDLARKVRAWTRSGGERHDGNWPGSRRRGTRGKALHAYLRGSTASLSCFTIRP
ncbi:MAG: helix-turn-helix domain-containing protein [Vicinamibacterales bacterium]